LFPILGTINTGGNRHAACNGGRKSARAINGGRQSAFQERCGKVL